MSLVKSGLKKPSFYIIGAPKSGTTSLAYYLSEHNDIFFSEPKEPQFWSFDHPRNMRVDAKCLDDYLELFSKAKNNQLLGEGSTTYLYSSEAVANILEFNPESKFIVILRNPCEVAYGYHMEQLFSKNEDVSNFWDAWCLQQERVNGNSLPKSCYNPQLLQYGELASFGKQVKRLSRVCPNNNYKVYFFEDFVNNPLEIYKDCLNFIGLEYDGRKSFPKKNVAHAWKYPLISDLVLNPPEIIKPITYKLRKLARQTLVGNIIKKNMVAKKERRPMDNFVHEELKKFFYDDVEILSEMTGRNLMSWVK